MPGRESSPTRPPAERTQRERRLLPWLASVVVHACLWAGWSAVPTPSTEPSTSDLPDFRPIELVELEQPLRPEPRPPLESRPSTEPPPPDPAESPAEPSAESPAEPSAESPAEPTSDRRNPDRRSPKSTDDPSDAPPPPDSAVEDPEQPVPAEDAPDGPRAGAVALLGLRDGRPPPPRGPISRPSLPPPVSGSGAQGRVGGEHASIEAQRDGKPRSLAEAGFKQRRNGRMVYRDPKSGFVATLQPDGRLRFRQAVTPSNMPGLAEALLAASGQELYHNQKRKLLERTYELRLEMAVAFASEKIDRRLKSLYRELLMEWSAGPKDNRSAQRVLLFDRWDECEEGLAVEMPGFEDASSSELDKKRRDAGRAARATIERFIRRQLPADSEHAYTAGELRTLNGRRHSKTRFAPYD